MLQRLAIRDVVLIEAVDIEFDAGLGVLTGETGAGKSILLDALGLALGVRADSGLVRQGAKQAAVTAEFALAPGHPARERLEEAGIAADDRLVVRRILQADGRSRAFVNDEPATVGLLSQLAETLIEVHGQHEQQGLLRPETHRRMLDAFGKLDGALAEVGWLHAAWRAAAAEADVARASAAARDEEADLLRSHVAELDALAPKPDEEAELAARRARLQNAQKFAEALAAARGELNEGRGVVERVHGAARAMGRVATLAGGSLDELVQALDRSAVEVNEAVALLDAACRDLEANPDELDVAEQRLFALRAAARKHKVEVAALPDLAERLRARLAGFEDRGREAARLAAFAAAAEAAFRKAARALHDARSKAAERLDATIMRELKPLRFEKAVFRTDVAERPAERWGAEGADDVVFTMATNPGSAPGALHRIASGGELARIMLALKVVLARIGGTPTLVFDEVDSGISGAVADAVGARLAKLAQTHQVLVVTHSPQVAARGAQHLHVAKGVEKDVTRVAVTALDEAGKAEEVARMLAGARVTDEARAAAASLIRAGAS